jgi:hypothetical protein
LREGMRSPDDYTERELQDMYFSVTQEHAEQLGPELTRQLGELLMGIRYARMPVPAGHHRPSPLGLLLQGN